MNERLKECHGSKVGSEGKTEFRVWPQNRASVFSRPNPQGLSHICKNPQTYVKEPDMHNTQTRHLQGQNGRLITTELTTTLPPSSSPAVFIQIRTLVFLHRGR